MFNPILLTSFILYIAALLIGFKIGKKNKKKHNKLYKRFKWPLYGLIYIIFSLSTYLLYEVQKIQPMMSFILVLNVMFIMYFSAFAFKETRCWKQHRMIPYNFFLVLIIYICSEILGNIRINYFVFLIIVYSILEFQFAIFSYKQKLIWD